MSMIQVKGALSYAEFVPGPGVGRLNQCLPPREGGPMEDGSKQVGMARPIWLAAAVT